MKMIECKTYPEGRADGICYLDMAFEGGEEAWVTPVLLDRAPGNVDWL